MLYGAAAFEGIRSSATRDGAAVFRLPEHLDRMRRGAERLGIAFDAQRAAAATLQTLRPNGHRDAYIRPLAWVGAGRFGRDATGIRQHQMVVTTTTMVHLGGKRTRPKGAPWRGNPAS